MATRRKLPLPEQKAPRRRAPPPPEDEIPPPPLPSKTTSGRLNPSVSVSTSSRPSLPKPKAEKPPEDEIPPPPLPSRTTSGRSNPSVSVSTSSRPSLPKPKAQKTAAPTNILCGICDVQQLTKCADHWCTECDEGLCNDCEKHHSISKASRKHEIIPIEDFQKIPTDISSIGHHCEEHEKKFQNYCPHHEKLCCPSCIATEHRSCLGLLDLDEIVKTSKTSVLIENLEKSLQEIATNIKNVIIDRKGNLAKIKEQQQGFHYKIKQVRHTLNTHLDELEQQINRDLLSEEQNIQKEFETLLNKLSKKRAIVKDLQNNIVAMKNHASNLQTFLTIKKIEERAVSEERYLQSIKNDSKSLKSLNLICKISDNIINIADIHSFGSISTHVSTPSVVLKTETDKQAQMWFHKSISNKTFEDLQLTRIRQFKVPNKSGITGQTFCPNGDIVYVDYGQAHRLLIMDSMGILKNEMPLPRVRPYDVTSLDDSTVAISTWEKNVIHVVDINSGTITECIRGNFCGGITRRGNTLVCCLRSNEIKTVDLRTNTVSPLISNVAIHPETYVTTSANKLFVTHRSNNTVTCYNMNGDNEWQYFDPSKVTSPLGVTVDRYNNVYVSCFGHNSVVLISPDGKQARTILDARDGLFDPYCVNFQNQNNLLVTSYTGDAFLYNIS